MYQIKLSEATEKLRKQVAELKEKLNKTEDKFSKLLNLDAAQQSAFQVGDIVCRDKEVGHGLNKKSRTTRYKILEVIGMETWGEEYQIAYRTVTLRKDGSEGAPKRLDYYETHHLYKEKKA